MITRPLPPAIRSLAHPTPSSPPIYSTRLATGAKALRLHFVPIQCRFFTSTRLALAEQSHYDILGVSSDVSKADLKKRFYALSKETHPDIARNRNNPKASERFSEVSEAYSILGNDEKRKKYDRDVMPRFERSQRRSPNANRTGSYAGSRPASGLSKRRSTFRGPPPSYYSGAAANAQEEARREQESYNAGAQAGQFDPSQYASPGQWDPIFNSDPVYKTQTVEDLRRRSRREAELAAAQQYADEESNFWARFIVVSFVVGFGVGVGTIINRMSNAPRGGLLKGDGSRRGREVAASR